MLIGQEVLIGLDQYTIDVITLMKMELININMAQVILQCLLVEAFDLCLLLTLT